MTVRGALRPHHVDRTIFELGETLIAENDLPSLLKLAADAGKHVQVQKPVATNLPCTLRFLSMPVLRKPKISCIVRSVELCV